jgi:hypothetical protein
MANQQLDEEKCFLEPQHTEQQKLLLYLSHAFEMLREGIATIFRDWDHYYIDGGATFYASE